MDGDEEEDNVSDHMGEVNFGSISVISSLQMDVWSIGWIGWIEFGIYLIEIVHGETLCSDNIDVGSHYIALFSMGLIAMIIPTLFFIYKKR